MATPVGIVRAHDLATARWIARSLVSAAQRLDRLSPSVNARPVEVWVVDDPGRGNEGVIGLAERVPWSSGWRLRVDAERGHAMLGHELFHARWHARLREWPAVLEEGLADRFGLPDDILGDCVRTDLLLVVSRTQLPNLTLEFARHDGTWSGLRFASSSSISAGPPPLEPRRMGALSAREIHALDYPARLYLYGVAYVAVLRWLGDGDVRELPERSPQWAELAPETGDELAQWAVSRIGPERMHRWAVGRFAGELPRLLSGAPAPPRTPEECLESMDFKLTIGDGSPQELDDDPHFRELLELLWPWIFDTAER